MATSNAMSTSNQYIKYTISIKQNSQSIADNTSNVTVSVRFYRTNTGYTSYGTGTVYCKINGKQYSDSVTPSQKITNSGIVLFTKTLNISHGIDGKKTLTCSAWISHDVVTSSEQSYSQALSTIYRASVPTVSPSPVKMGNPVTINTNSASSSFTHTLKYTFGGTTATIATGVGESYPWKVPDLASKCNNATSGTATITCITYNGSTKIGTETCTVTVNVPSPTKPVFTNGDVTIGTKNPITTNAGSANFTHLITYSFNGKTGNVNSSKQKSGIVWDTPADLAGAIKSDTGNGTITCTTYNGTANVGSETIPFKGVVPNNSTFQPIVSNFGISPSGNLPADFNGLYIQSKTGVKANFSATSTYSKIASYELEVDGKRYEGNPAISDIFTQKGGITVRGIITDERGFSKTEPKGLTVQGYRPPTIEPYQGYSSIICERTDPNGNPDDAGTHLTVMCRRKYSPIIVDGVQKNFCDLTLQYKEGGGTWSDPPKTLLEGANADVDEVKMTMRDIVTQTDKSYTIKLIVTDTIGSKDEYEFPIPTADVTMHLGKCGYGVAFGKYSEATPDHKMVEIDSDWDLVMDGEAVADFVIEQGATKSGWEYRKWASGKAECWGRFSVDVAINEAWGCLYMGRVAERNLPFEFASVPTCMVSTDGGNTLMIANAGGTDGAATTNATQKILLLRTNSIGNATHTIQYTVYGRWK